MSERDLRVLENMARTGMEFDDLLKAFNDFPIEEVEKVYMKIRKERFESKSDDSIIKMNCS